MAVHAHAEACLGLPHSGAPRCAILVSVQVIKVGGASEVEVLPSNLQDGMNIQSS